MKKCDDMHRSLFSDILSHNSTENMHEYSLKFREMKPAELLKQAKIWLDTEFKMGFNPKSLTRDQYDSTIGGLVEKLKEMIESERDIPPDFLAGLYSILVDIRTCSRCGPISKESETLLIEKAEKAMELLQ